MSMGRKKAAIAHGIVSFLFLLVPDAAAQGGADKLDGGNTAWILTSTALVLFMTIPGLALFYGGLVRSQNERSVLMHCFAICCLISVLSRPRSGPEC